MELKKRIIDSQQRLADLEITLAAEAGNINHEINEYFGTIIQCRHDYEYWLGMLAARNDAKEFLANMKQKEEIPVSIEAGYFNIFTQPKTIRFHNARLLGIQAYIIATWSLAENITEFAGKIMCAKMNKNKSAQFIGNFINKKEKEKNDANTKEEKMPYPSARLFHEIIKNNYGWALGISYAIRNSFVHDGGVSYGNNMFKSKDSADHPPLFGQYHKLVFRAS